MCVCVLARIQRTRKEYNWKNEVKKNKKWVAVLILIFEVPGSNIGLESVYPD
jgi:hypothetical protein